MVHSALTHDVDIAILYAILRLRSEVFVVEQDCAYLDPDGRDLESGCVQLWVDADEPGAVAATARLLREGGDHRIGRVCTDPAYRSRRLGTAVMTEAIGLTGGTAIVINAQSQYADWYATFGFAATGWEFVEDGIAHTEMRRP